VVVALLEGFLELLRSDLDRSQNYDHQVAPKRVDRLSI
jgi:hypothetical protein